MKKLPVLFIFILFSLQVYAESHVERRFVPVAIYHVDENSFTRDSFSRLLIAKPLCLHDGKSEINAGTVSALGWNGRQIYGFVESAADVNFWMIRFDENIQRTHLTIMTYCSYSMACDKQ